MKITTIFLSICLLAMAGMEEKEFINANIGEWTGKANTQMKIQGQVLTVKIMTESFKFGWFRRAIPVCDTAKLCGIKGRVRCLQGHAGSLSVNIVMFREKPLYFSQDIGQIASFENQWREFFLPMERFSPIESNSQVAFSQHLIQEGDNLQFVVAHLGLEETTLEIDSLQLVMNDEDPETLRRLAALPVRNQLLEHPQSHHPRLILQGEKLAEIRAKATKGGHEQTGYETLLRWADKYLETFDEKKPLAKVFAFRNAKELNDQGNHAAFETMFAPLLPPIEILAAAGIITGREDYSRKAAAGLVNMARALDVHSPEMDYGFFFTRTLYVRVLALGYDWLYNWLGEDERRDVQTTLLGFVLDIYEKSWTHHWGKHPLQRVWNWNPGLASCTGLGMMALEGETTVPENAIIFQMRRHLKDYLTLGIDPDGACHEGPSYINYGIGCGVLFMEALRLQGRGDLFVETNAQLIAPWLAYEMLPGRKNWNNLGDCNYGQPLAGQFYIYASGRYAQLAGQEPLPPKNEKLPQQAVMTHGLDYLQHFPDHAGERLLSYHSLASIMSWACQSGPLAHDPTLMTAPLSLIHTICYQSWPETASPATMLTEARLFRGRGLVVSRVGFDDQSLHLAIEAGPHAAGHDQADKGSFTFRAFGMDMFIDSGYGNDGHPRKSSSSFAHNMVLVDGQGQPIVYHNNSNGNITGFLHSADFDWIRVDALDAWNQQIDKLQPNKTDMNMARADRQFVLIRSQQSNIPPYLIVYDDICKQDDASHEFSWLWHFDSSLKMVVDADKWTASKNPDAMPVLTTEKPNQQVSATFTFTTPAAGDYKLAGLTACMGDSIGQSDSFSITVNNHDIACWDIMPANSLVWSAVQERGEASPYKLSLQAGENVTVVLRAREAHAELAKLALIPYESTLPTVFDGDIPKAVVLSAGQAVQGEEPFILRPFGVGDMTRALVTVYPLNTAGGKTTVKGYQTSRLGMHQCLVHTVEGTRNPQFFMLIIPRATPDTQLPKVQKLSNHSVRLDWAGRTDTVVLTEAVPQVGKSIQQPL